MMKGTTCTGTSGCSTTRSTGTDRMPWTTWCPQDPDLHKKLKLRLGVCRGLQRSAEGCKVLVGTGTLREVIL